VRLGPLHRSDSVRFCDTAGVADDPKLFRCQRTDVRRRQLDELIVQCRIVSCRQCLQTEHPQHSCAQVAAGDADSDRKAALKELTDVRRLRSSSSLIAQAMSAAAMRRCTACMTPYVKLGGGASD